MARVLPNNVFFTTKLVYEFSRYISRPRLKNRGACTSCYPHARRSSCIEDPWMDGNLSLASGILTPSTRSSIWQTFWRLKAPSWRQGASLPWWLRKFVFKIMFALAEIHSRFMAHWWFCEYTWSYPFFPLLFRRASYMSDICKVWRSGKGQPGQGFWDHHGTQIDGRSCCWPLIAFHMKLSALPCWDQSVFSAVTNEWSLLFSVATVCKDCSISAIYTCEILKVLRSKSRVSFLNSDQLRTFRPSLGRGRSSMVRITHWPNEAAATWSDSNESMAQLAEGDQGKAEPQRVGLDWGKSFGYVENW